MTRLITIEELKSNGFVNENLEDEYLFSAIDESQNIYLREILGDKLYDKMCSTPLEGIYLTILNDYIKYYLKYKVLSVIVIPLNFKIRNMGVTNQYGPEVSTTTLQDTTFIENYYAGKADFYANRLTNFLVKNRNDIPEYKYCCKQITNPNEKHPNCSIYLG